MSLPLGPTSRSSRSVSAGQKTTLQCQTRIPVVRDALSAQVGVFWIKTLKGGCSSSCSNCRR